MILLFISVLNTLFTFNQSNIYFMPHDFIFLLLKSTTYKITVRSMAHAALHRYTPLLTLEGHSWACVIFFGQSQLKHMRM